MSCKVHLLYHDPLSCRETISPFDEAIISLARNDNLSIACPYTDLSYLRRILRLCRSWRLLTDVHEWLGLYNRAMREEIYTFLRHKQVAIRHYPTLHAKVLVSSRSAIVGSANLTNMGITKRVEMAVRLEGMAEIQQVQNWFNVCFDTAGKLQLDQVAEYIKGLPADPIMVEVARRPALKEDDKAPVGKLVNLGVEPSKSTMGNLPVGTIVREVSEEDRERGIYDGKEVGDYTWRSVRDSQPGKGGRIVAILSCGHRKVAQKIRVIGFFRCRKCGGSGLRRKSKGGGDSKRSA